MSIEATADAGHTTLCRPVVLHVLTQHAEEAAFCWLRRQEALWRPSYRCSHQQRLDQLLDAHLEGLRVAAPAALPIVLDNLQRWKTPDSPECPHHCCEPPLWFSINLLFFKEISDSWRLRNSTG